MGRMIGSAAVVYSGAVASSAVVQRTSGAANGDWSWFAGPSPYRTPAWYRVMEIAVAATMLILTAPLLLAVAILIKLESAGPVVFVQKRLTASRRPFDFFKLRTMYSACDRRFPQLAPRQLPGRDTAQIRLQIPEDPRVTPLGRWLRRTSIDELPNFWHVITGDMALVGPRPEITQMLPHYRGAMLEKFSVRPGITGYAQIYGRGDLGFLETVVHDLQYVQERSLGVDLRTLMRTVLCVFTARGAY